MTPGVRNTLERASTQAGNVADLLHLASLGLHHATGTVGPRTGDANAVAVIGDMAAEVLTLIEEALHA